MALHNEIVATAHSFRNIFLEFTDLVTRAIKNNQDIKVKVEEYLTYMFYNSDDKKTDAAVELDRITLKSQRNNLIFGLDDGIGYADFDGKITIVTNNFNKSHFIDDRDASIYFKNTHGYNKARFLYKDNLESYDLDEESLERLIRMVLFSY